VHEPQKEIKPVQFAEGKFTFTQSTSEQRKEIIRIAKQYERPIFHTTEGDADEYPYAGWDRSNRCLCATRATPVDRPEYLWLPFDEFVARLKGEWVEPTKEPAQRDYSHLINKWVRYCYKGYEYYPFFDKWTQVKSVRFLAHDIMEGEEVRISGLQFKLHDNGYFSSLNEYNECCFDLTDIRDTNPDEVERIIPFDIERWRKGEFVRVQTRDGREVKQLTEFESVEFGERFSGVLNSSLQKWYEHGAFLDARIDDRDLMLVVKGEGGKP
jgi:hypothetical protein